MEKKIAFFIPVYNESEALKKTLSQIPLKVLGYDTEIIIADDCSHDDSVKIARNFTDHIIVMEKNMGVGAATKKGFEYLSKIDYFDFVVKFDGDGQHHLHFIPEIILRLIKLSDVVICSRFHPLSDQTYTPVDRILLNMIFTEMLRKITSWNLTDVRSGYMGFKADLVKRIAPKLIVERYGIPMEILLRIWKENPDAIVSEISHPAVYGGNISARLQKKYSSEQIVQKSSRLQEAYSALLAVIEDMKITKEKILEINGFFSNNEY